MNKDQEDFLKNLIKGNDFLESIFKKSKPILKTGKEDLDSLMQEFLSKLERGVTTVFLPRTNIKETEKAFFLEMEIAGVKKEDISIYVEGDMLVVTGKKEQSLIETEKYTKIEMAYGKFERKFNLPVDIEKEFIDGKVENGILYIEIPKKIEEIKEDPVIKVTVR